MSYLLLNISLKGSFLWVSAPHCSRLFYQLGYNLWKMISFKGICLLPACLVTRGLFHKQSILYSKYMSYSVAFM